MTRDYSGFLGAGPSDFSQPAPQPLAQLGWGPFFATQTDIDEIAAKPPVRVTAVHRSGLNVKGDGIETQIPPGLDATVGDWVLLDHDLPTASRVLARKSLIKRRAAGHDRSVQLIAANVDTVFIVTSCNADFNVARLERYVALAFEAEVTPVILLTKADLCDDPSGYLDLAQTVSDQVPALVLDARQAEAATALAPWCGPGQTVAFLGSSGVGKSTLSNALAGTDDIATQAVREDDAKGRHTTTHRQLYFLPSGCAVLDTPGMRELQLTDAASGVADLFAELEALAATCKFNDCAHDTEPGCAIRASLAQGDIDGARVQRWQKLAAEERHNTATLAARKSQDKSLGKMIKGIQKHSKKR